MSRSHKTRACWLSFSLWRVWSARNFYPPDRLIPGSALPFEWSSPLNSSGDRRWLYLPSRQRVKSHVAHGSRVLTKNTIVALLHPPTAMTLLPLIFSYFPRWKRTWNGSLVEIQIPTTYEYKGATWNNNNANSYFWTQSRHFWSEPCIIHYSTQIRETVKSSTCDCANWNRFNGIARI